MNLLQDLFQKVAVVIVSIVITLTSIFTGQKLISTPIPTPPVIEHQTEASPTPYKSVTPTVKATSKPTVINKLQQKLDQKEQPILSNPQKEQIQNSSSQNTPVITYSEADCEKQVKDILPKVEVSYIDWWNQFQEAKKSINPCYQQESTFVCDRKLSDLNVEWQNKITDTINSYKEGLSSCNPNEVKFSKFSNTISSSY